MAEPPSTAIPLVGEMEALNVVPDTDLDGIVQVDHDQTSFGNDTGSISFEPQRDMAQVYVPLNTDGTDDGGALPVSAYLVQGDFGTSAGSIGTLTTTNWTYADASPDGQPYAYSLDTRVQISMLVNDASNHIKRMEVVRPGGNTVVFDFPWDASKNEFSPIGTPTGINASRLYVLRALAPQDDASLSYEMLFPSGIVQTFNGGITSVSDSNSGLSQSVSAGLDVDSSTGDPDTVSTPRYDIDVNWANGTIASVDYATDATSTGTTAEDIETILTEGGSGSTITSLDKSDLQTGDDIPEFSYAIIDDGATITNNGIEVDRTGSFASGSVTLTQSVPDNDSFAGTLADTTVFNSDGLITSDTVTVDEGDDTTTDAVTTYDYSDSRERYDNGSPQWGKVTEVSYPDGSWESFGYDSDTGWLTQDITPFKSSSPGDASTGQVVVNSYDTSASGGMAADPDMLVQPPRKVLDEIAGTIVSSTLNRFASATSFATAHGAGSSSPTWASGKLQSTTTLTGYNSYNVTTPTGSISQAGTATSNNTTSSFNGNTVSQSTNSTNPFGGLLNASSIGIGQDPISTAGTVPSGSSPDPFGRTVGTSVNSGKMTTSLSNYGWLGAAKAVDPSGVETDYTYTPFGQIATSSSLGIVTTYVYDLAGNVIHVLTTGNYLGQSTLTTDTYATYDALGRMTSSTDEMGRVTNYAYSADSSGMTTTITYNDDSTMVEVFYLDGTPEGVSGTAVTPSAYDEGVESNGDNWTLSSTNEGQNWTKTFTNALGQQYQTQRSGPDSATETATTVYDGNGRPIKFTDFDGTITYTDYDPDTGMVADTWQDVAGTGVFDASIDPKTTFAESPISTDDSTLSGETDEIVAEEGNESDSDGEKNAGLDSQDVSAGQTTTTHTDLNTPEEGDTTVTTTNPDGTQVVDEYTDGRLTDEKTLGADHATEITDTSYGYDALGRNNTITDWTGTTTFSFFADGSVSEVEYPDGRTQTVDDTDPKSGTPTEVTLPNGQTQDTGINSRGQQTSQSGGGVLPAEFTYDANTGALTTMKLFQSGTLDSGTPETTTWAYDPATGLLTSKTYNDGTSDVYTYNAKLQLATLTRPGTFTNYTYNAAGQQTSSAATDTTTGNSNSGQSVTDSTGAYDDQGRPTSVTQTTKNAAGQVQSSDTNAYTYTAAGDLKSESQAAGVTTVYTYYPATGFGSTGAPDALESVKLIQGTATLSESDYTYDPVSKRLATVTVNGQTFTHTYKSGTNLVESITASNVSTAYGYEATTGRLSSITSTSTADDDTQTLYSADYTYYTNDQRETESVTQVQPDGTTDSHNWTFTYDDQNELTGVTNTGDSSSVGTYGYDGAGNRNDSAYTETYGTANAMNQLSALSYNGRGDLIDDGTQNYTWDATDELTEEKPDSPTTGSTKEDFQYDAQERRTEEDVYNWNGTAGAWDTTADKVLKFAYQGSNLVAELDGSNHMVTSLTWGLSGALIAVTDDTGTTPKTYMVVQDGTSNTVALEDPATGAVMASYEYAPFGTRTKATGSAVNVCPLQYADMVFDGSAALPYYAWHRYYSPATNEWLSRDPIAEQGGLNTGEYAGDDPINASDPTGLATTFYITKTAAQLSAAGFNNYEVNQTVREGAYVPTLTAQLQGQGLNPAATQTMTFTKNGTNVTRYSDGNKTVYAINQGWFAESTAWKITQGIFGSATYVQYGVRYFDSLQSLKRFIDAELFLEVSAAAPALMAASAVPYAVSGVTQSIGNAAQLNSQIYRAQQQLKSMPENPNAAGDLAATSNGRGCFCAGTPVLCSNGLLPIEYVTIGRRVPTTPGEDAGPSFDPTTHRVIRLRFVKDGQEFHMSFLRPAILFEGLGAGDQIQLSVLELKVKGPAQVLAITPCPAIDDGVGRVVTGAFRSQSVDVRLLKLEGLDEPIEVTANHPIYSEDHLDFTAVRALTTGERVRTRDGVAVVESMTQKHGQWEVFNIEIEGDHRYYITGRHVLVHNVGGNETLGEGNAANDSAAAQGKTYEANPQHAEGTPSYKPGKEPEPSDAADSFRNALPEQRAGKTIYWGQSSAKPGVYYRFSKTQGNTYHFSGSTLDPTLGDAVPGNIVERLNPPTP